MGLIFKKEHIDLILRGVKTQTRRKHQRLLKRGEIYPIKRDWYHSTEHKIKITKVRPNERLGDITPREAVKEGGYTIDEFREVWGQIYGRWNPDEEVVVYEFKLVEPPEPENLNGFLRAKKNVRGNDSTFPC